MTDQRVPLDLILAGKVDVNHPGTRELKLVLTPKR